MTLDDVLARTDDRDLAGKLEDPDARAAFVAEILPDLPGAFEFSDCNCDEECAWDGISRRCDCGNRRVEWVWDRGHWTAEAY